MHDVRLEFVDQPTQLPGRHGIRKRRLMMLTTVRWPASDKGAHLPQTMNRDTVVDIATAQPGLPDCGDSHGVATTDQRLREQSALPLRAADERRVVIGDDENPEMWRAAVPRRRQGLLFDLAV